MIDQQTFESVMAAVHVMKPPKFLEWWRVENTGWSNGQSWFTVDINQYESRRFKSSAEAIQYIQETRWDDPAVKWRYVHVTLEREDNKTVTTEIWTEV